MPAPGPDAPLRLPPRCNRCQANPVAWTSPRVDFCYQCLPGGPFPAPSCRWCGTAKNYFSQGLCIQCHPRSPHRPGACKGCMAWGVYPRYNWTCWPCRWWRTHYPEGVCDFCGRLARIGNSGACRLCVEQAQMTQEPGRALDYAAANRHSQQLFLANMLFKKRITPRLAPEPSLRPGPRARQASTAGVRTGTEPWKSRYKNQLPYPAGTGFHDEASVQSTLFDMAPDPEAVRRRVLIEDSELTRFCAAIVDEHAARYGWSVRQRNDVRIGDREIPLAAPVRTRLAAWLDHRQRRWPGCINPHLLVSRRTTPRLVPVGHSFPWRGITLRPQALREDRILHEIHATGGDVRRICDLFGLGVEGATRYLRTVEHADLTIEGERVTRA